jgi:hypothetical protein
MGAAWLIFALAATSIALASGEPSGKAARGEGDELLLGKRNPSSGEATHETAVVNNEGSGGLVIRPSNTAKGGRAISATCDNDGTAAEDGCAVYVNKGTGAAATFRTSGTVPFAIRDTNTGLVQFLNADRLDSLHASEIVAQARTKAGLAAETADTATSATSATTATTAGSVGGVSLKAFNYKRTADAASAPILGFGGLVLNAACTGSNLDFTAGTIVNDAQIDSYSHDADDSPNTIHNKASDDDFDTADTKDLAPDGDGNEVGSLRYSKPDGTGVQVEWHAHDAGPNLCAVNGVASAF